MRNLRTQTEGNGILIMFKVKHASHLHEKTISKLNEKADKSLEVFKKTEQNLMEANAGLHETVAAIDYEMDQLAHIRIQAISQLKTNENVLTNIKGILGKEDTNGLQ